MTATQKTLLLSLGIILTLVIATLIGQILRRRYSADTDSTIESFNARVRSWWLIAIVVGLAFAISKSALILLFGFISFIILREFITLVPTRRGDHWALAAAFFFVLPFQYYLIWVEWYGLYTVFIPVYVFLLLPIITALRDDTVKYISRVAIVQWGLMITVFCLSHVPALLTVPIPGYEGRNIFLIVFLIIVVQSGDIFQYLWGRLFGRHKIALLLSPSKTIEGFLGGIVSATALGTALWWITPFTMGEAALMAFLCALMGFYGGLVMAAIKRDRGIKDWGRVIPGHGGMLDRLDSVIFAAPVFFHLLRYGWIP